MPRSLTLLLHGGADVSDLDETLTEKENSMDENITKAFEAFMSSGDLEPAILSSTKASWGGSGYSVELLPDATYRVIRNDQIGNKYCSPGVILPIPALDSEEYDEENEECCYEVVKDLLQDIFQDIEAV
jgi:hypothetical protein